MDVEKIAQLSFDIKNESENLKVGEDKNEMGLSKKSKKVGRKREDLSSEKIKLENEKIERKNMRKRSHKATLADEQNDESEDLDNEKYGKAGRWTKEEHEKFLEALTKYGKNWKLLFEQRINFLVVHKYVGTRSTTQARSHAQKYFQRMEKKGEVQEVKEETKLSEPDYEEVLELVSEPAALLPENVLEPAEHVPEPSVHVPDTVPSKSKDTGQSPVSSSTQISPTNPDSIQPLFSTHRRVLGPMPSGKREIIFNYEEYGFCKKCKKKYLNRRAPDNNFFHYFKQWCECPSIPKPEPPETERLIRSFSQSEILPETTREIFIEEHEIPMEANFENADLEIVQPKQLLEFEHSEPLKEYPEEKNLPEIDWASAVDSIFNKK